MTIQETNSGKQVVSESLFYLLGSILSRALSFIMLPLYSRCLTPAEYGTVELAELATSVVGMIFGMSVFGAAMTRLYQDCRTGQDQNRVVSTAIFADLLIGGLAVGVAISLSAPLSHAVFKSAEYAGLLRATFISMFFATAVEVCLVHTRLKRRARFFLTYSMVSLLATVLLNIIFLVLLHAGVWGFVLSKLIVTSLGGAVLLALTLKDTGMHFDLSTCRRLAHFGMPLIFANISLFFVHFGDRFFLGRLAGLAAVGSYSLAYKFSMLITTFVGEPFHRAWSVRYCSVLREPASKDKVRSASKVLAACLLTGALGIALFSREIITVMAPASYAAACSIIPIVVLGYLLRDFADFFRNFLFVAHRSKLVSGITVVTGLLNCVLNAALIPAWGIKGAALATLATWIAYWIIIYRLSQNESGIQFPLHTYLITLFLSASAYVVSLGFGNCNTPTRISLKGLIFVACTAVMFRYGGFTPQERNTLSSIISGPLQALRRLPSRRRSQDSLVNNAVQL